MAIMVRLKFHSTLLTLLGLCIIFCPLNRLIKRLVEYCGSFQQAKYANRENIHVRSTVSRSFYSRPLSHKAFLA